MADFARRIFHNVQCKFNQILSNTEEFADLTAVDCTIYYIPPLSILSPNTLIKIWFVINASSKDFPALLSITCYVNLISHDPLIKISARLACVIPITVLTHPPYQASVPSLTSRPNLSIPLIPSYYILCNDPWNDCRNKRRLKIKSSPSFVEMTSVFTAVICWYAAECHLWPCGRCQRESWYRSAICDISIRWSRIPQVNHDFANQPQQKKHSSYPILWVCMQI
jgi:hypothetical protein